MCIRCPFDWGARDNPVDIRQERPSRIRTHPLSGLEPFLQARSVHPLGEKIQVAVLDFHAMRKCVRVRGTWTQKGRSYLSMAVTADVTVPGFAHSARHVPERQP